jgi:beta-glucanase (GH16 family)
MKKISLLISCLALVAISCQSNSDEIEAKTDDGSIVLAAGDFTAASDASLQKDAEIKLDSGAWFNYELPVKIFGRYKVEIVGRSANNGVVWIEDYINNKDGRSYNITGNMTFSDSIATIAGSPLDTGLHPIRLHVSKGSVVLKQLRFTLLQEGVETPKSLTQNMIGDSWDLVWSDEFDGNGLPDSTKWSYNAGNWGWGNNEPQYYTAGRIENARQENGVLIIEARKNDMGNSWTSARLTTQGKQSFLYGKIEFRAKVPVGRGTWSAGWLLGDDYRDELSWPYCGEIDVLECVGFEINDSTGNGENHASCHTRAYYFKQGNQITATTPVENMNAEWHTYSIEWYPDVIYAFVDGVRYYTYDKNGNELEWPFAKPQNIILNLAVGGGWGGAQGIDENWNSHQFIIDYVRVYEATNTDAK